MVGEDKVTSKGRKERSEESVQDLCGQAVEGAEEAIDAVRKIPGSVEDSIREYIFKKPFSTAAIALGLGWLLGRSHRPF